MDLKEDVYNLNQNTDTSTPRASNTSIYRVTKPDLGQTICGKEFILYIYKSFPTKNVSSSVLTLDRLSHLLFILINGAAAFVDNVVVSPIFLVYVCDMRQRRAKYLTTLWCRSKYCQ
jgi:hypothetical protein